MLKLAFVSLVLALCGLSVGCSSLEPGHDLKLYQMGEPVKTGSLVYTVLDTQWLDQLGTSPNPRLPRNHFLAVRISVVNNGPVLAGISPLSVTDSRGVMYTELNDASGLPEWLGYLRTVRPAETLHGLVLFDVPTGDFRLRVSDDAEPEERKYAAVELPLELTRPQVRTDLPAGR
jgi:hypothetical protein